MSRVVVCALARNEREYINDWLLWYTRIGADHFYIYDNDDLDAAPLIDDVRPEYRDKITIISIRGRHESMMQHHVYQEFYAAYGQTFDWCLFIDVDEFLSGITSVAFVPT